MRNMKQFPLLNRKWLHRLKVSTTYFQSHRCFATVKASDPSTTSAIHISTEAREAIQNGVPVVALESTIITHGMPYPKNLDMAKLVEKVVRDHGAVPATIAIIGGTFKVGLSASELENLAKPYESNSNKKKLKISRKDLAYAHASESDGGTTVAATMILAHKAGISFFATGGIGGVHRGAEVTMDISTDLTELSKTPIVVVCAGIKSILDIPKTLEVLETYGVPVVTFDSQTFPAFFTNDSGIASPLSIKTIDTIAKMALTSNRILHLNNGMIVSVPNPNPADSAAIQIAINQALQEAEEENISGNKITPFLLARIEQLTQGQSLESNIALVLNNAKIAAQLAVSYQQQLKAYTDMSSTNSSGSNNSSDTSTFPTVTPISNKASSSSSSNGLTSSLTTTNKHKQIQQVPVMIFGGCVVDIIAKSSQKMISGSSNPGVVKFSYGGVGRNIAERMSVDFQQAVSLVTVVGEDENGKLLMEHMDSLCVDVSQSIVIMTETTADVSHNSNNSSGSNSRSNNSSSTTSSSSPSSSSSFDVNENILNSLQSRYIPSSSSSIRTANYLAIHHHDGDLYGGIADMNIFQYLSPDYIRHSNCVGRIRHSVLIICDGNLRSDTLIELLKISSSYHVPVFFEPTSDAKCVLPIVTQTIHLVDVIKPNVSELVTIMAECFKQQPSLIKQGIPSVQKALINLQNHSTNRNNHHHHHHNNSNNSHILNHSNNSNYDNMADVRILACALQNVMKSSSSSSSSSMSLSTAEGRYRKVRGKHVIVSLGARGVVWVGPKSAVTRLRAGDSAANSSNSNSNSSNSITSGSRNNQETGVDRISSSSSSSSSSTTAVTTVIVDDHTAMKIFPAVHIPEFHHHHHHHVNTNGAGDAFCAGVISSLLDSGCDELDTHCILTGLQAAADRIISTNPP